MAHYTMTGDRFTVGCTCCGFLSGHSKLSDALRAAKLAQEQHREDDEIVTTYDVMARRGCAQKWGASGKVLHTRID